MPRPWPQPCPLKASTERAALVVVSWTDVVVPDVPVVLVVPVAAVDVAAGTARGRTARIAAASPAKRSRPRTRSRRADRPTRVTV